MTDLVVVLCTVPDEEVGASLARTIVDERLAACVNLVPGLRSIYSWKGEIQDDREVLLIAKTRGSLFGVLRERIVSLHPYDVPEIVALSAADCHGPYLDWVHEVTG
ncbi:MAG: divalent-cation tolerance protein CutA [Deltaproteobacteria bacterium]|nr:divalent-cation tolerance protein CutA [Deltaproteobacteria bacterium]